MTKLALARAGALHWRCDADAGRDAGLRAGRRGSRPRSTPADTAWMIAATALVLMMTHPGPRAVLLPAWCARRTCSPPWRRRWPRWRSARCSGWSIGYSLAFTGDGAGDRHVRARVPARHGHERDQPARQDHPGIAVHDLPDDLRDHHRGAGRRLGRRPHALLGLSLVRRAAGCCWSMCRSRIGCGAAASSAAPACSISPAALVVHLNAGVAGLVAAYVLGTRRGYGTRQPRALRSVARGDRHRPAVGRLVRLQRRLGARRQFARRLSRSSRRISPPAPAR